ncbi:MAG: D-tyrosyl-tRNA(Tyr) deacylase [Desulfobacteraceae bacterium]|jgi:D-tyrosyl-tRNA(Tyr) deacylase|nr:MAG: D-tyrosyl-tRNA(Tyr) deacylase [Desulfobacteraceae bacterium]
MRAVVQRVKESRVRVDGEIVGSIGAGLLIFLGVGNRDTEKDCEYLSRKIIHLRVFSDENGLMNRSVIDVAGEVLVVSQFTLWGDCRKGRRPSFADAASPEKALALYQRFLEHLSSGGIKPATGRFQEMMEVYIVNDGPVTIMLDSGRAF